jgi:hypothetical protein
VPSRGGEGVAKKPYDLIRATKDYKGNLHEFFLDLTQWRNFKSKHPLQWSKVRFDDSSRSSVAQERGIYVFTVELSPSDLPGHGYIMYVGITGADASLATLRTRYGQYLRQQKKQRGRPAVTMMLVNWKNDLFFNFAPLPNAAADLPAIETAFLEAIIPPVNKAYLSAKVRNPKAAAF